MNRKQQSLSLEMKQKIITEVEDGILKKKDVAKKFGIACSTISTILKNREKIETAYTCSQFEPNRKRLRTGKNEDIEAALLKWIREARNQNVCLTGAVLQEKACSFADAFGCNDFTYSSGWLQRFKGRYGIVCKKMCKEQRISEIYSKVCREEVVKEGYNIVCKKESEESAVDDVSIDFNFPGKCSAIMDADILSTIVSSDMEITNLLQNKSIKGEPNAFSNLKEHERNSSIDNVEIESKSVSLYNATEALKTIRHFIVQQANSGSLLNHLDEIERFLKLKKQRLITDFFKKT